MNAYSLLVLSQIMLGSLAVFVRWAQVPAEILVLFRCGIGATAIGFLLAHQKSLKPYLKADRTLALLVATGLFMAMNWFFFFKAILSTNIASAILLYNFAPLFVLLSASIFLRETPTSRQIACVVVSILGVLAILGQKGLGFSSVDRGAVFALIAGALYAQVTVIGRKLKAVPAPVVTFFQTSVGAVLFFGVAAKELPAIQFTPGKIAILIMIGLFHTAIPYLMYFKALQNVKATIAGILQYVYTLSTIVFGAIFFRETVSGATWVGGTMILIASYIALKHPGKKSDPVPSKKLAAASA